MNHTVRTLEHLSQLLQAYRKARGLTQSEMAALVGVSQQMISNAERNPATVNLERFLRLLFVLDVELVLRDRPGDMPANTPPAPDAEDW